MCRFIWVTEGLAGGLALSRSFVVFVQHSANTAAEGRYGIVAMRRLTHPSHEAAPNPGSLPRHERTGCGALKHNNQHRSCLPFGTSQLCSLEVLRHLIPCDTRFLRSASTVFRPPRGRGPQIP